MGAHINRRNPGQFFDQWTHLFRTERTVHSDAQQRHMGDGIPEGLDRLASHTAIAPGLNECDGCHDRHTPRARCKGLLDSEERGFRVQRVENRFHQQHIGTAIEQPAHLLAVGSNQLFIGRAPRGRIIDIGRNGGGLRRRSNRPGDKAPPPRLHCLHAIHRAPRALRSGFRQFIAKRVHPIIGQRDCLRVECIGLNNVRPGFQILPVNIFNDGRLRDIE